MGAKIRTHPLLRHFDPSLVLGDHHTFPNICSLILQHFQECSCMELNAMVVYIAAQTQLSRLQQMPSLPPWLWICRVASQGEEREVDKTLIGCSLAWEWRELAQGAS